MDSVIERAEKARRRVSSKAFQGRSWSLPTGATDARLRLAGICVAVALASGMLLSPALWLTRPAGASLMESFPMVAPLSGLEILALPAPFDSILFATTLVLCAAAAVAPRRPVFATLFLACVLLALPDMMRWQPWFYLYLAVIGALAFIPQGAPGRRTQGRVARPGPLSVLRILVGCVYLYSGLNKLNASFFAERLGGFLAGMPALIVEGTVAMSLTYSAPFLEIVAGFGLLLGGYRVRHAALILAASTNLLVLAALLAAAANTVVIPWNVAMIVLVITLFAGRDEKERRTIPKPLRRAPGLLPGRLYAAAVIILFAAAPAAGVAGYWPAYLSFALYSESIPEAQVRVGGALTSVTTISYESLNVPPYPSLSVYQAVAQRSCAAGPQGSVLVIRDAPDTLSGHRERRGYTCAELAEIP